MPSWQSSFFTRFSRMGKPRAADADTDIAELRRQYTYLSDRFGAVPRDAVFEPASLGPVKGEWVRTDASAPRRLILYFHGGGYIAGSPETHRALVAKLAHAAEASAFTAAYRLAPEHPFPAAVRDGIDAYRQLLARGLAPQSIVLGGNGSGGGLAFAVLLAIRNAGLPMPAACVAMSPWADLSLSGWSVLQNARNDTAQSWDLLFVSARHYLKRANPSDPYASPVFASFKDFPPIMVHAGSMEMLRDDASRLGDRAADAGVPVSVEIYDGMQHCFQASPYVPEARVSLQRLGQFIRTRTPIIQADTPPAAAQG
ncbi:MAG: alpha/beta hydrolase [Alphaproteobacteria bacterium]|nr:alpha/beta hydrolase [Alphaproteobacteria bacterium]MDE2164153.1 alpha/beta hydrolase [Alphaproteobacteria bacterium]MDE2499782.1 alpha/beta hydrolase [Alphaproteobacteria bacterium]